MRRRRLLMAAGAAVAAAALAPIAALAPTENVTLYRGFATGGIVASGDYGWRSGHWHETGHTFSGHITITGHVESAEMFQRMSVSRTDLPS